MTLIDAQLLSKINKNIKNLMTQFEERLSEVESLIPSVTPSVEEVLRLDSYTDLELVTDQQKLDTKLFIVSSDEKGKLNIYSFDKISNSFKTIIPEIPDINNVKTEDEIIKVNTIIDLPSIPEDKKNSKYLYLVLKDDSKGGIPSLYVYHDGEFKGLSNSSNSGDGSGGGFESQVRQIGRLGITASQSNPRIYSITIPYTDTFAFRSVEVLKFAQGRQSVSITQFTFDNSDFDDFIYNERTRFLDGYLQINSIIELEKEVTESDDVNFKIFKFPVKREETGAIDKIEITSSGIKIN